MSTVLNLRAHKIRLTPTAPQIAYCERASGTARYSHNWCLNVANSYYALTGATLSDSELRKLWNTYRKQNLPWTYEVTKHASDSGVIYYCNARRNWFNTLKERKKEASRKAHFRQPKLKTKRRSKKSFVLYDVGNGHGVHVDDHKLILPKLGVVRMTESVRFPGRLISVTISEQGGHWFASFLVEISESYVYPHRCETQAVIGVDLGLNAHLTLSTGKKVDNPKLYRRFERKLAKAHRVLSRKQKGSANREKAKHQLSNVYTCWRNCRCDHLHQMTTKLSREYRYLGMEDLGVANMMKNHSLARALADASFGEIHRQLVYKTEWAGSHLMLADRYCPSSKLCSVCGYKNDELKLSDREWTCPKCDTRHDRDVNAAQNLEIVARGLRDTLNACVTASSEMTMGGVAECEPRGVEKSREQRRGFRNASKSRAPR